MPVYTGGRAEGGRSGQLPPALGFLVLALVSLYLPPAVQGRIGAFLRGTALRPFLYTQEVLIRTRAWTVEATRLESQLDSLAARVAASVGLEEENRHLRELLGLRERLGPSFLPAGVLRPGTPGSESMFLLDVGSAEGVRPGSPVLVSRGRVGLVGVVREVRESVSIGIDWSHPDFRASAMTRDGAVYGIVEPRRGAFREEDRLLFNGTPFYTRVEPGTMIVTSGLGGVYPRGIPLGFVESIAEAEAGWRKAYWVRPAVEPGSVTHVLVVLESPEERDLMEILAAPPDTVGTPMPEGEGGMR